MKTPPDYATKPGSVPGVLLMMLGGLTVVVIFIYQLINAILTGTTAGRLGAIHRVPSLGYWVGVSAFLIGIALGCALMRMGWVWLQHNRP